MPSRDRHQSGEITIFSRFAKACGLPIRHDSIEKRDRPEPDIQCTLADEGSIAFEMVELIHCDFAALTSDAIRYSSLLAREYEGLPVSQREALKNSFGNALVHVEFRGVPSAEKRKALPHILCWLQGLDTSFSGDIAPEAYPSLSKTVRKVTIRRSHFNGPCFDTGEGGVFADPLLDPVRKKFTIDYDSDYPMELLTYHELHPVLPDAAWIPRLHDLLVQQLEGSRFRRAWMFDVQRNVVTFVCP